MPADITAHTADPTGTVVNYTLPTATDNEDPNPTVTCTPASGSKFAVGTHGRHLHGQGRQRQHVGAKTFNVVVGRDVPVDASAAPCRRRWR